MKIDKDYKEIAIFLYNILDQGLPDGSLVITLVRPSITDPSLNISKTAHQFLLKCFRKLGVNKVKKLTQPGIQGLGG